MLHTNGKSRGQVLVLSCATMLILALMLMVSFNVSHAINEKIRLQSHADAQAYSSAIIEARTLNTLAYSNRSIAALMVAQTAVHAWWAIASQVVASHKAFQIAFYIVAAIEIALCVACCWACCIQHCKDAIKAFKIASKHGKEAKKHANDLKGLESKFNKVVSGFTKAMKNQYLGQRLVVGKAITEISVGGKLLGDLKSKDDPKASYKPAVEALGVQSFRCSLEGMTGSGSGCGSTLSVAKRSQLLGESANAARRKLERGTDFLQMFMITSLDEIPMSNHLRGLQGNEGFHFFMYNASARVSNDHSRNPAQNRDLKNAGGWTYGHFLFVQWRHGVGFGAGTANVISDGNGAGGGQHKPSQAHSGNHQDMLNCAQKECFINFRAVNDEGKDWGQPTAYGSVTAKLRETEDGSDKPYELNSNGEVTIELVKGQQTKVRLVPQGTATAVAKGKAFFHQLKKPKSSAFRDNAWQNTPNMFDPFWRAKLNSFSRGEMLKVLGASGDTRGAMIAGGGGPVEGR